MGELCDMMWLLYWPVCLWAVEVSVFVGSVGSTLCWLCACAGEQAAG
jgi:hypothetical protein